MVKTSFVMFAFVGSAWLVACERPTCTPITGCDIREGACQHEALRLAACLRGVDAESDVQVEVVDYDTYADEQARAAQGEEPSENELDFRSGLTTFNLAPSYDAEQDARDNVEWVGAFYDRSEDRITVLDRGRRSRANDRGQTFLLVHEMIHALQGAEGRLSELYEDVVTYDQSLAVASLIEGEATFYEDRGVVEALGFDFDDIDYARALRAFRQHAYEQLKDAENLFVAIRSATPYAYGASHLHRAYQEGGEAAVAARLDHPIASTRELFGLKPTKARVKPPIPVIEGATFLGSYHLGGFFLDGFLRNLAADAPEVLEHVVDDVFSVQRSSSGQSLAAWRIRFDDEVDADSVLRFIRKNSDSFQLGSADESDLWILRTREASSKDEPAFMDAPEVDFGFTAPEKHAHRALCPHAAGMRSALP